MPSPFPVLYARLRHALGCGTLLAQSFAAAPAAAAAGVGPSDCTPGHADSSCAATVAAAPAPAPPPAAPSPAALYDGPMPGLPGGAAGYWGYDFAAAAAAAPSPVPFDMYINRSGATLALRFSFDVPAGVPCGARCLPRIEMRYDAAWYLSYPRLSVVDGQAVAEVPVKPGQAYAWVVGLQQTSNPRLRVTADAPVSLTDVGLTAELAAATPTPSRTYGCACADLSVGQCNFGTRFTSGLMGVWTNHWGYASYFGDGWTTCEAPAH